MADLSGRFESARHVAGWVSANATSRKPQSATAMEWMATAKSIAVAGYHRVSEDGPELTATGSPEGSSGPGGDHSDSEMYAADMFDEEGDPMSALIQFRGHNQDQPELFRRPDGLCQRYYYPSATTKIAGS
jgi:hypothetical protein